MYVNVKVPFVTIGYHLKETTSAKNIPFKYCFLIKVRGRANDKVVK
jgi:hypothetical protein